MVIQPAGSRQRPNWRVSVGDRMHLVWPRNLHDRRRTALSASRGATALFYEICALSNHATGLRAGDVCLAGSRQYRAFHEHIAQPAWRERPETQPVLLLDGPEVEESVSVAGVGSGPLGGRKIRGAKPSGRD